MTIYLLKDNDDLVSHCNCEIAYSTFPPQMDCPWCGCGWLFTCIECRKAFTFAKAVDVPESLEELAARDLKGRWSEDPSADDLAGWVEAMTEMLADISVGEQYVCFDGVYVPTSAAGLNYNGWHAAHDLDFVPQVAALTDNSITEKLLANQDYWQANALPDDNDV